MKKSAILLALVGVALGVAIIVWLGAGKVIGSILAIGWGGFGILVGWQLLIYIVLALAWRVNCPGGRLQVLIFGRLVREGGANLLPFSEAGALVFGARAVTLLGIRGERAAASSLADVVAEFVGEMPFLMFGFVMLLVRGSGHSLVLPLAVGLALMAVALAGLIWAEHHMTTLFHAIGRRIGKRWARQAEHEAEMIQADLESLLSQPRRMAGAAGFHLLGWIGGGITVWIAYRLLGGQIGLVDSIAIEALLSGALAVAFLVPGGLGVQEVSYVLIGTAFGMPASLSLGLSLLRRARNIVIGAPSLIAWQVLEARRLRTDLPDRTR